MDLTFSFPQLSVPKSSKKQSIVYRLFVYINNRHTQTQSYLGIQWWNKERRHNPYSQKFTDKTQKGQTYTANAETDLGLNSGSTTSLPFDIKHIESYHCASISHLRIRTVISSLYNWWGIWKKKKKAGKTLAQCLTPINTQNTLFLFNRKRDLLSHYQTWFS